jgi:phage FluMu protein Com
MSHINKKFLNIFFVFFIVAKCPRCRFEFKIELPTKKKVKSHLSERRLKIMYDVQYIIGKNYPYGIPIQRLYHVFKSRYGFVNTTIVKYIRDMISLKLIEKPDSQIQYYTIYKGVH